MVCVPYRGDRPEAKAAPGEEFAGLTSGDLIYMLSEVIRSDPPPEDADFIKRACNEIVRRERAAAR